MLTQNFSSKLFFSTAFQDQHTWTSVLFLSLLSNSAFKLVRSLMMVIPEFFRRLLSHMIVSRRFQSWRWAIKMFEWLQRPVSDCLALFLVDVWWAVSLSVSLTGMLSFELIYSQSTIRESCSLSARSPRFSNCFFGCIVRIVAGNTRLTCFFMEGISSFWIHFSFRLLLFPKFSLLGFNMCF